MLKLRTYNICRNWQLLPYFRVVYCNLPKKESHYKEVLPDEWQLKAAKNELGSNKNNGRKAKKRNGNEIP